MEVTKIKLPTAGVLDLKSAIKNDLVEKITFDSSEALEDFFLRILQNNPGYKTKVIGKSILMWKLKEKKNE
jgi:hypothetical protein